MVLWQNYIQYGTMEKNYGTAPRIMELRFTKEKKYERLPKTRNFDL